jgi:nucleotide sugar dehydrogenase
VPGSLDSISKLYSAVFESIVPVSRPEVAEMSKLYENCQRMVMIAYANEMADACIPHGVDPFEVCAAAATKPFGYAPFTPSLGVGGHCIPINPYYLLSNSTFPLLQAATEKMWTRPAMLAQRALETLSHRQRKVSGLEKPRVLIVGVGFKAGQATLSTSPGLELAKSLILSGRVDVSFADTLVPQSVIPQIPRLDDESWTRETLETFDMIIIAFRQVGMDFGVLSDLQDVLVEMWCR